VTQLKVLTLFLEKRPGPLLLLKVNFNLQRQVFCFIAHEPGAEFLGRV
jgi:hypothetical protein